MYIADIQRPQITLPSNSIISEYLMGESVLALAHKYCTNTHKIQHILDNNNINKISQAKRFNPNLKEDYFLNIDSDEKAYWLGWILTDGGISNNHLEITLQIKDIHILEMLSNDLGVTSHGLRIYNEYVRFSIGSVIMCKQLAQYGVIPNKTKTLKFPDIDSKYTTALIRGMFEGDGGLTLGTATRFNKQRGKSYTTLYQEMSFTGTYDMCEGFQRIITTNTAIAPKNITRNHSIFRVRWSNKKEILQIFDLLYTGCNDHYLKRKYDLFCKLRME